MTEQICFTPRKNSDGLLLDKVDCFVKTVVRHQLGLTKQSTLPYMTQETRQCQNCKQNFVIEPEDFVFYKKISVPPPTWCPECRLIRRLSWRNERVFYKRACDLSGETIISVFSPEKEYTIYSSKSWWSDTWDALSYGMEYDFSLPFFTQLESLMKKTPLLGQYTVASSLKNSDYTNMAIELNNCYMITNADYNENCSYASYIAHSNDCMDCFGISGCELSYEIANCVKCYNTRYSFNCDNCVDVYFSRDLAGCQNCFGCVNLRNKQYYIWNKPCSKEEYRDFIKKSQPLTHATVKNFLTQAQSKWMQYPVQYMKGKRNVNVSGDYIDHSKNARGCFYVKDIEDCKYCSLVTPNAGSLSDSYDCSHFVAKADLSYESIQSGHKSSGVLFTLFGIIGCRNIEYGAFLTNCSNCFGCVSLRNKNYCILNKQYTKGEYEKLVPKIIEHMNKMPYIDKKGRTYKYGEFFPPELSPFGYNETTAQEYFPLSAEAAAKAGYKWKEPEKRNYQITMTNNQIPDNIKDAEDSITDEIISCAHEGTCNEQCTSAFRIIPKELKFYRRMNLPLPRLCPNCRHHQRIKQRNPLKLWHRTCMCNGRESRSRNKELREMYKNTAAHFHGEKTCPNEFETTYSPERKEIVYCEACYLQEIA